MIIIALIVIVVVGIGTAAFISNKSFMRKVQTHKPLKTDCDFFKLELSKREKLKENLKEIRANIGSLDIPVLEVPCHYCETDDCIDRILGFMDKYNLGIVGSEQFMLDLLSTSQVYESLFAFAEIAGNGVSEAFTSSINTLKENFINAGGILQTHDGLIDCLHCFNTGIIHYLDNPVNARVIANLLNHHELPQALVKVVDAGIVNSLEPIMHQHDILASVPHTFSHAIESGIHEISIDNSFNDIDVSGHVPVITIALSTIRETKLLLNNKTNFLNAIKNISLDAVGTGVGALAGAQTGAMIGSLFGPVGAVVGGFLGGITGAIGGRTISNEIKRKPLKNAIESYQTNYSLMENETKRRTNETLEHISKYSKSKREQFRSNELLKDVPSLPSEDEIVSIATVMYASLKQELDDAMVKIGKMKTSIWYRLNKNKEMVAIIEKELASSDCNMPSLATVKNSPEKAIVEMLDLTIPDTDNSSFDMTLIECKRQMHELNTRNNASLLTWGYLVNGLYRKTINEIVSDFSKCIQELNDSYEQWKRLLDPIQNTVIKEGEKLGVKIV